MESRVSSKGQFKLTDPYPWVVQLLVNNVILQLVYSKVIWLFGMGNYYISNKNKPR